MKKITLLYLLIVFASASAQDVLHIVREVDPKTGKESFYASRILSYENPITFQGLETTFLLNNLKYEYLKFHLIDIKLIGFECIDDVEVTITFENEDKMVKKSIEKMNCEGKVTCYLTAADIEKFYVLKIKKIRVTNAIDPKKITNITATFKEKDYFIKLIKAFDDREIYDKKITAAKKE